MGRVQEAIIHFREAIRLAPCRLDCYEGKTVNCQCDSVGVTAPPGEGFVRSEPPSLVMC